LDVSDSTRCVIGQTMGNYAYFPGDEVASMQKGFSILQSQSKIKIQGFEYDTPFGTDS